MEWIKWMDLKKDETTLNIMPFDYHTSGSDNLIINQVKMFL